MRILRERELSPRADQAIEMLAVAGALTVRQIKQVTTLQLRSLQKYHSRHILDRISLDIDKILDLHLVDHAVPREDLRAYALGAVGLEYARLRLGKDLLPYYCCRDHTAAFNICQISAVHTDLAQ
jgi:hypothetical protein